MTQLQIDITKPKPNTAEYFKSLPAHERCPVTEQGILYHMVTKWTLSTKAISLLKAHFKSGYTASQLHETLRMNKSKIPSNPKQNMPKGKLAFFIPIYSNTSRQQIERDSKHYTNKHQKYFLSFRYLNKDVAFVIIQRSNVNDFLAQRVKDKQILQDRRLEHYYKEVKQTLLKEPNSEANNAT